MMFGACKHDIINDPNAPKTDTTIIVAPPVGGGGTSPLASDTVCFNTEVLPLYSSYCGSSGCHDIASHKEGVILTDYSRIMLGIRAKQPNNSNYFIYSGEDCGDELGGGKKRQYFRDKNYATMHTPFQICLQRQITGR